MKTSRWFFTLLLACMLLTVTACSFLPPEAAEIPAEIPAETAAEPPAPAPTEEPAPEPEPAAPEEPDPTSSVEPTEETEEGTKAEAEPVPEPEETAKVPEPEASAPVATGPKVTKEPTTELVEPGGSCLFIARAEGAIRAEWHFRSPNGREDYRYDEIGALFPELVVQGAATGTLELKNIPAEMDGWKVYCRFSDGAEIAETTWAGIRVEAP